MYLQQPAIAAQTNPLISTQVSPLIEAFKPKKAGKKTSHVIFILDESSSMCSVREQTIQGFNEFLDTQRNTDVPTFITLYKFNGTDVKQVYYRVDVNAVEALTTSDYDPNGMTNLNDAIGGVMLKINGDLSSKKKKNRDSIMICVMTDGAENMSGTFRDTNIIKAYIEKAEGKNWGFTFIGADIDAFAAGSVYGFKASNTMQFDKGNISETMRSVGRYTNTSKVMFAEGSSLAAVETAAAYTTEEREEAVK